MSVCVCACVCVCVLIASPFYRIYRMTQQQQQQQRDSKTNINNNNNYYSLLDVSAAYKTNGSRHFHSQARAWVVARIGERIGERGDRRMRRISEEWIEEERIRLIGKLIE